MSLVIHYYSTLVCLCSCDLQCDLVCHLQQDPFPTYHALCFTANLGCPLTLVVAMVQSVDVMTCTAASAQADCEKITNCSWQAPNATDITAINDFMASIFDDGEDVSDLPINQAGECLPTDMTFVDYAKEVRCPGESTLST